MQRLLVLHFIFFLSECCTFLFTFVRKCDIIELSINKRKINEQTFRMNDREED